MVAQHKAALTDPGLRERVASLESELTAARAAGGPAGVSAAQVDALRSELARAQQRARELEADFLGLEVLARRCVSAAGRASAETCWRSMADGPAARQFLPSWGQAALDLHACSEVGGADSEMRKAWHTAAAFKKRWAGVGALRGNGEQKGRQGAPLWLRKCSHVLTF